MCGRGRCALAPEEVAAAAGVNPARWRDAERYQPRHNVHPGAWTPVVRVGERDQQPELHTMAWGLVPSWTKPEERPDHFRMFNARSETLCEKAAFSRLVRGGRRCAVLMDGFYEWKRDAGGRKQPYYVHFAPRTAGGAPRPMLMAGLYDVATRADGFQLYSYTIVTVDAPPRLSWLHDRMPALLPDADAVGAWLSGGGSDDRQGRAGHGDAGGGGDGFAKVVKAAPLDVLVERVCQPYDGDDLSFHPVTAAMSDPKYDRPDACVDMRAKKGAITAFFGQSPAGKAAKEEPEPPAGKPAKEGPASPSVEQVKEDPKSPVGEQGKEDPKSPVGERRKKDPKSPVASAAKQESPGAAASAGAAVPGARPKRGTIMSFFSRSPPAKREQDQAAGVDTASPNKARRLDEGAEAAPHGVGKSQDATEHAVG